MGPDKSKLTNARNELEDLYSGVPDDSVNLTFQHLAEVTPKNVAHPPEKRRTYSAPEEVRPLSGSLDFNPVFEGSDRSDKPINQKNNQGRSLQNAYMADDSSYPDSPVIHQFGQPYMIGGQTPMDNHHYNDHMASPYGGSGLISPVVGGGKYGEMSVVDNTGGRRRPGIPHSNICAVCSTYIYIFRHRCLVCGRVYCRQCLSIGMGEMSEGRKCIECLGRRFSQRYIQEAGSVGCCTGYPTLVKQQELKWAEKGPRQSGENRYGEAGMVSKAPRSPAPSTPGRTPARSSGMNSPYSPYYVPTNQPLPF